MALCNRLDFMRTVVVKCSPLDGGVAPSTPVKVDIVTLVAYDQIPSLEGSW